MKRLMAILSAGLLFVVVSGLSTSLGLRHAQGSLIAWDDFESYADGSQIDGAAGGGGAWDGNWTTASTNITASSSDGIPGYGTSMRSGEVDNSVAFRRSFTGQSETFYVGFALRTNSTWGTISNSPRDGSGFFQFYLNTTGDANQNSAFSGGIGLDDDKYFVRRGSSSYQDVTTQLHENNTTIEFVLKFSKSGNTLNDQNEAVFDGVALFLDQATEGTPDAVFDGVADYEATELTRLSSRLDYMDPDDVIYLDNLKIATTYSEALPSTGVPEPTGVCLAILSLSLLSVYVRPTRLC